MLLCVCWAYPASGEPGDGEERLVDEGTEDVHEGSRGHQIEGPQQGLCPVYDVVEDDGRHNGQQSEQPHPACREPFTYTLHREDTWPVLYARPLGIKDVCRL